MVKVADDDTSVCNAISLGVLRVVLYASVLLQVALRLLQLFPAGVYN